MLVASRPMSMRCWPTAMDVTLPARAERVPRGWGWPYLAAGAVMAADQLTKWWAVSALDGGRVIDIVWTLRLRLVFNTGAAFSRFDGLGPVIAVVAVVIAAVLLHRGTLAPERRTAIALGSMAGGALGNVVDRLARAGDGFLGGAVVDFIDVQWWPVWNVADMGIVVGGAALVVFSFWRRDRGER